MGYDGGRGAFGLALALCLTLLGASVGAQQEPLVVEPKHRLAPQTGSMGQGGRVAPRLALTLDACSGEFDAVLMDFLIRERIPATLFVTRRWIRRNAAAVELLKAHAELFQIENHGTNHVPAVIGPGREVYGIAGMSDMQQLHAEVQGGALAIESAFGVRPHWYRGATAVYDRDAEREIERLGYRIAGYSLNADAGATLGAVAIEARLRQARDGDVVIAHMNKPRSATALALAAGLADLKRQGWRFVRLERTPLQPVRGGPTARTARGQREG